VDNRRWPFVVGQNLGVIDVCQQLRARSRELLFYAQTPAPVSDRRQILTKTIELSISKCC